MSTTMSLQIVAAILLVAELITMAESIQGVQHHQQDEPQPQPANSNNNNNSNNIRGGSRASMIVQPGDLQDANMVDYLPHDPKCFETTDELRHAVSRYQNAATFDAPLASTYGWPIGTWCVGNVKDFSNLFAAKHHRYFNEPLNEWDMSSATDVSGMFQNCHWFHQPLDQWDVSQVTTMSRMFAAARTFDHDLGSWHTERVQDMSYMFLHAFSFQHAPNSWNIQKVTTMEGMFRDARSLDHASFTWDVSHVQQTGHMMSSIPGVSLNYYLRGDGGSGDSTILAGGAFN